MARRQGSPRNRGRLIVVEGIDGSGKSTQIQLLRRWLGARAKIKFYEAGMDLGLSADPVESFRLFQGRVLEEYDRLSGEYGFRVIDGTRSIDAQQRQVRDLVSRLFDHPAVAEAS